MAVCLVTTNVTFSVHYSNPAKFGPNLWCCVIDEQDIGACMLQSGARQDLKRAGEQVSASTAIEGL